MLRALEWFLEIFPGLARPLVVACTLGAVAVSIVAAVLVVFCLRMGVIISAFFIGASGLMIYWAGMCWLLSGTVCSPVEAMVDFTQRHWLVFMLLTVVPGSLLLLLMKTSAGLK